MFPTDATTTRQEINGTGNIILASSTRTVLYVSIQKTNSSKISSYMCGTQNFFSSYSNTTFISEPIQYVCNNTITYVANGSGLSSFIMTYINRDINTTINPNAASTTPFYSNGFSYGDIVSIMFLILIFTLLFFDVLKNWILGHKIDGVVKIRSDKYAK
jgi:hypothetical protein